MISSDEAALVKASLAARLEAIEVDVFTREQFFGTAANVVPVMERRVANG